jgi:site-specific recombinase XerD
MYRRKSFFDYACNYIKVTKKRKVDQQTYVGRIEACRRLFGELRFGDINAENLKKINQMLVDKLYSNSYIQSIFYTLYAAIHAAVNAGLLQKNQLKKIALVKGAVRKDICGLSQASVQLIEETEFKHSSLQFVAALFSFQCRTGLSYIDLVNLKYSEIQIKSGKSWLIGARTKTANGYIIPLDSHCLKIIEKYRTPTEMWFQKQSNDSIFPFIRRETYNACLKRIGAITGIKEAKEISSHKARHTFAERMLERGVSVESIRKMLGHTSLSLATWLYAKVTFDKLNREVGNSKQVV